MCFDICTINIRVSIRVRGLHLVGEKIGLLWKNVWLHVLKLWKDEGLGFILSVGPEVFVSTSILKYEKNDSKLAPILGAGKRLPKWESAPFSQNGGRIVCFFEGIAWHSKAEFDNLQTQVFEFWVEPSVGKVCLA